MSTIQTIRFRIQGPHENNAGEAVVVSNYWLGVVLSTYQLPVLTDDLHITKIGIQDGYVIYACYYDSGSDFYTYFALKKNNYLMD